MTLKDSRSPRPPAQTSLPKEELRYERLHLSFYYKKCTWELGTCPHTAALNEPVLAFPCSVCVRPVRAAPEAIQGKTQKSNGFLKSSLGFVSLILGWAGMGHGVISRATVPMRLLSDILQVLHQSQAPIDARKMWVKIQELTQQSKAASIQPHK